MSTVHCVRRLWSVKALRTLLNINVMWSLVYHCFLIGSSLGTTAELWRTTVSFGMSVCPSLRPHRTVQLPLDGFSWNLMSVFRKSRENSGFFNIWLEYWVPYLKTFVRMWQYYYIIIIIIGLFLLYWIILTTRNVSDKSYRENRNTHFMFAIFSRKSSSLWDKVGKNGTVRLATDGSIIRRMCFACWIPKATNTHSRNT